MPDTPAPVDKNQGNWIVVSLPDHTIDVMENGEVVRELTTFATGRIGDLTPILNHVMLDPNRREKMHHSSEFNGAPMPFAMFFYQGCAFHEGNPEVESHGCVHLPAADAEWLFDWAGSKPVNVQIEGPQCEGPHPGLGPQPAS